jgi:magnesium transporter
VNTPQHIQVLTVDGLQTIEIEELPGLLQTLKEPVGPMVWIHAESTPAVAQALDDMGLGEIAVKSLLDGPERPRVEEFADHLYISLFSADHLASRVPEDGAAAGQVGAKGLDLWPEGRLPPLKELRLFLGPRWIISVGHVHADDYDVLVDRMRRQVFSRKRGASFVAYHLCEWLVETLQPALDELDDRIDGLEDEVVLGSGKEAMQQLFALKRDLVDLRRRIAPLRDVMQRLGSNGVLYVEPETEVYFRDVHDDVMRVIELLDTYRDILSSALDLHLSSVSNRLNKVMKQLTVVATMFMPLSFLVGLFGTNFTRMPFGSYFWFIMMWVLMFISLVGFIAYTWKRTRS